MPNPNTPVNAFSVGNQFYKLASFTGRPKLFDTPADLLAAAFDYFDWVENNPLIKYGVYGNDAKIIGVPKMRAMSLEGLCCHIGVCNLRRYKQNADFAHVCELIYNAIYVHNLDGALVGALNPCIVARVLGLRERTVNNNVSLEVIIYNPESNS
jgi:hypothetical protein